MLDAIVAQRQARSVDTRLADENHSWCASNLNLGGHRLRAPRGSRQPYHAVQHVCGRRTVC